MGPRHGPGLREGTACFTPRRGNPTQLVKHGDGLWTTLGLRPRQTFIQALLIVLLPAGRGHFAEIFLVLR